MLNISQVNIVKEGYITGIISKIEFLKKKKEEKEIMRKNKKKQKLLRMLGIGNSFMRESVHGTNHAPVGAVGLLDNMDMNMRMSHTFKNEKKL